VSGQLSAPAALPPAKLPLVPIAYAAGRTLDLVWTLLRKQECCLAGNKTLVLKLLDDLSSNLSNPTLDIGSVLTCNRSKHAYIRVGSTKIQRPTL
jgi:hypothetical protein